MEGSFCFVKDVRSWPSQYNRASFICFASTEFNYFIFSYHHLTDGLTRAQFMLLNVVECAQNVCSQHSCESLSSVKIGMLDYHYTFLGKELLWVVINQLTVNENIRFVVKNFFYLHFHFFFLSCLDLGNFIHRIDLNFGAVNFNFVIVHWSVGDEDLWILFQFWGTNADRFLKDESLVKIRVFNRATWFLDNLNVI